MRIGELNENCGECRLFYLCGVSGNDISLCNNPKLANMLVEEYVDKVENIRKYQKRNWSNKTLEKMITHVQ